MADATVVPSAPIGGDCAKEPIHIPGSIQPHGFLLALDEPGLTIRRASVSCESWLDWPAEALLGRTLHTLMPVPDAQLGRLSALVTEDGSLFYLGEVELLRRDGSTARFQLVAHRHDGVLMVEFEPGSTQGEMMMTPYALLAGLLGQLQHAVDLQRLCELAVGEVKRLTGFGRALLYDFDHDGHGRVLAEACDPDYPSYLGLHFPASDIPEQARALYRLNRVRVIHNADYQPVPVVPVLDPQTGQPLDLSHSVLRSVSPVHLQYMRNMGTLASMSISLVVEGRLWGLISCHDHMPHPVPFHIRTACELLGRIVSLQIEAKEAHALSGRRLELRRMIVQMLAAMADCDSVAAGLLAVPETLLAFGRADGAAIIAANHCDLVGQTPPLPVVRALADWLRERTARGPCFTDNAVRDVPELPGLADSIGGFLAVSISELHAHYLVWFRSERLRTVNWAGQPKKQGEAGPLTPRSSFALWQEQVAQHCLPWDEVEVDSALELRNAVLGIVLRKAEEMAGLAEELQKTNKELEAFSYSVSHDLRAPLRHIAGYAELLESYDGAQLSERGQRYLEHIAQSARFAGTLVDNLLTFSQMGRSALRPSAVNLNNTIEAIRREMVPDYEGRQIDWVVHPLPQVTADAAFLHLALRNLLANAIKYTRSREAARIEIGSWEVADEVVVYIRDNGVGFDMRYVSKLFGVFQRLHRLDEFEGTGIGLASVRRIIERHDGRVWAEGVLGEGATFYFALPAKAAPHRARSGG
ncbi:GAF domain-containing protein [Chitiniphilus purpureus]|uniref:histidine kinase n=1 Tax=Chitiniphilus purpureus TaxID=2981137 RepID=A0ABY6DLY3_9NEIS|nr:ATP-binding protein [Chitiniphilus sp. CD1]UXY15384.1 GAF domain-containing protein [Chitiniphilus sp. CD1]